MPGVVGREVARRAGVVAIGARRLGAVLALGVLAACATPPPLADHDRNPEAAGAVVAKPLVEARRFMLVTAHPLATAAGERMLAAGGSAVDAAIAAQLVLNLVEPQSSGIGGGGFLVHRTAAGRIQAFDGRETAPAAARAERFVRGDGTLAWADAVNSGLAVGTPGLLRMLELAHREHGRLPWATLFEPAIALADDGFPVSPRLHALLAQSRALAAQPAAAAHFFDAHGRPWPVGHRLRNPAFAAVLRALARDGADAFYHGEIARDIVAAVRAHATAGDLDEADLVAYRAHVHEPLCSPYRRWVVCGAPPPAGTLTVLQLLGVLEHAPLAGFGPNALAAVHHFAEAGRLAYADREHYLADPAYVRVPVAALLDPGYLRARAALIDPHRSMGRAAAGDPDGQGRAQGAGLAAELAATTHLVAVDAEGNALSMTTSIESAFGSKIFVRGFLLNNQLTDFSLRPVDAAGRPVANRVAAGKRPRSAMAPLIVLRDGAPVLLVGSPGGSAIINYIAKTVVGVLDWNLDVQQAIALPNFGSRNQATELERDAGLDPLVEPLRAMGHVVRLLDFPSGVHAIVLDAGRIYGGADPRREGRVAGE